jgi:hypothetical protein
VLEVIVATLAGGLAAEPADHRLNIDQGAIAEGIDSVESMKEVLLGSSGLSATTR